MTKKNAINGLLITVGSLAAAGATTLSLLEQRANFDRQSYVEKQFENSIKLFDKYVDLINLSPEEKANLESERDKARLILSNPDTSVLTKYKEINRINDLHKKYIFNFANNVANLDKISKDNLKTLNVLLSDQANRLREKDLVSQFGSNELTNLKISLHDFDKISKSQRVQWVKNYQNELDKFLTKQDSLINDYLIQDGNTFDDNIAELNKLLPTKALKNTISQNISQIEHDVLAREFRINDIEINKRIIENKIIDAKGQINTKFNEEYVKITGEITSLVNANVESVGQTLFDSAITNNKNEANSEVIKKLINLIDLVKSNKSIEENRVLIESMIQVIEDSGLLNTSQINSLLIRESINNYFKLSDYYLNNTKLKLESSQNKDDIIQANEDIRIYHSVLNNSSLSNTEIIQKLKERVYSYQYLSKSKLKNVWNRIITEKNIVALTNNEKPDSFDKAKLLSQVLGYTSRLNSIRYFNDKLSNSLLYFEQEHNKNAKCVTQQEILKLNREIDEIIENNTDLAKIKSLVDSKLEAMSTLIETRKELDEIKDQIKNSILNLNDYPQQVKDKYLSKLVEQQATDLINQISDANIFVDLVTNQIVAKKYSIREQLRSLQKVELSYLYSKTNAEVKLMKSSLQLLNQLTKQQEHDLESQQIDTTLLEKLINELNTETQKIVSVKFNPVVSTVVLDQIKKYKFLVNVLETTILQNQTAYNRLQAQIFAERTFNPTAENPHEYTTNEKIQLDKLQSNKDLLQKRAQNINDLLGALDRSQNGQGNLTHDQKMQLENSNNFANAESGQLKILNDVANQIGDIQNSTSIIRDLKDSLKSLDKVVDEIKADADIVGQFTEEFEKIDVIKTQISNELKQNPVNLDKINKLQHQATELIKTLKEKRNNNSVEAKLKAITADIDKYYPAEEGKQTSSGENALRKRLEDLIKESKQENLTTEQKKKILEKAELLKQSIAKVKEIEDNLKTFEANSEEFNASPDKRSEVPKAIADSELIKNKMDGIFKVIQAGEEMPTLASIEDAVKKTSQMNDGLVLAFRKDQIKARNESIQSKAYPITGQSADTLKNLVNKAIKDIDSYAQEKDKAKSDATAKDAVAVLTAQNNLIEQIKRAIIEKENIQSDPALIQSESAKEANNLGEVIKINMPAKGDTSEMTAAKMKKITEAIEIAKAKHELRKVMVNELNKVLSPDQEQRTLLASVKTAVKTNKTTYNDVIENTSYTPEAILQKAKELHDKVVSLNAEKEQLIATYNKEKARIDLFVAELDQKSYHEQTKPDQYTNFDDYEKARQNYVTDCANILTSTIDSMQQAEKAMRFAYNKDLVQNRLLKYSAFVEKEIDNTTSTKPTGTSNVMDHVGAFKDKLNNEINKNIDGATADLIIQNIDAMENFNNRQKDIIDLIHEYENDPDIDTHKKALEDLNALLGAQYQPLTTEQLNLKDKTLLSELKRIKTEAGLKSENKKQANMLLQHFNNFRSIPELNNNSNEIRVKVNEVITQIMGKPVDLGNLVDNSLTQNSAKIINSILAENLKEIANKDALNLIKDRIEIINQNKIYYDSLGLQVGSAETLRQANANTISDIVKSYLTSDLQPLIDKARILFSSDTKTDTQNSVEQKVQENREKFIEIIKAIEIAKNRIKETLEISGTVDEAKNINQSVDFFEKDGISGTQNTEKLQNWLNSVVSEANNNIDEDSNAKDARISLVKEKSVKALEFIKVLNEVSKIIQEWKTERKSVPKYNVTVADEKALIQNLWDILPNDNEILLPSQIEERITKIKSQLTNQTTLRNKRKDTLDSLNEFKNSSDYNSATKTHYLGREIDKKIETLLHDTENAKDNSKMNDVIVMVNNLKSFMPKLLELATKLKEVNDFNNSLVPLNDSISQDKDQLSKAIDSGTLLFRQDIPTDSTIVAKQDEIDKNIKLLDLHMVRLDVNQDSARIQSEIENDTLITKEEKDVINAKITEFNKELKAIPLSDTTPAKNYYDLRDKWLSGEGNDSIKYVIKNSRKLTTKYREAESLLRLQRSGLTENVDSNNVKNAYDSLSAVVNNAKNANKIIQNNEEFKVSLLSEIDQKISKLVSSKIASAKSLKTKTKQLLDSLKLESNNANSSSLFDNYEQNAVNVLNYTKPEDATPEEVIESVNKLIEQALDEYKRQIKNAFDVQHNEINKSLTNLTNFSEFLIDSLWGQKTKDNFNAIIKTKDLIKQFIDDNNTLGARINSFVKIDAPAGQDTFVTGYLNKNFELINNAKDKIEKFIKQLRIDFDQMIKDKTGLIDLLNTTFKAGSKEKDGTTLFEKAGLIQTQKDFNEFSSAFEKNKTEYTQMIASTSANDLQNYVDSINSSITQFDQMITTFKNEISGLLAKRIDLSEIYKYLFKSTITWGNEPKLSNLEQVYGQTLALITSEVGKISKNNDSDNWVKEFNTTTTNNDAIKNIFTQLPTLLNWANTNSNLFFENVIGTVDPDEQQNLVKPYYQIVAKPSITREEFKTNFEKITNGMENSSQTEIDITNNDQFLNMFDKFKFTKLDDDSIYNPLNMKVYIVKQPDINSFLQETKSSQVAKSIKIKLRYKYQPSNLSIYSEFKGFETDRTVEISFTTKDELKLLDGSADIFFKDYNKNNLGYNSKQVIAKADELGWEENDLNSISAKTLNTFKKSFGIVDETDEVIIDYANHKIYDIKGGNVSERTGFINSQDSKFDFKFLFPEFYIYQQFSQINADSSKQMLRIRVKYHQIYIEAVLPSVLLIGNSNIDHNTKTVTAKQKGNFKIIQDEKTMPAATTVSMRFAVDYDANTKNIYLFTTRFETWIVAKHRQLNDPSIKPTITWEQDGKTAYNWSNIDFSKWLVTHGSVWQTEGNNNNSSPLYNLNNTGAGCDKGNRDDLDIAVGNDQIWTKNPRSAECYIWSEGTTPETLKNTRVVDKFQKLSTVYNSGVFRFMFKDIKPTK
ncbi:hypothetical protein KQ878_01795 [Mycoplasma zalophidermidis]|uniref:Uncharacterized protein n=1 Tax=Mycoplasma zalophidermidis TaxID=398174 RepID=A0ABS6DRX4_9MOLU|nr:hypothetical protein [Mycoplasma zalophidermidis]MBU4693614.1 hypothetical protein [Mycoplasma zalophidermidis]